MAKKKMGRPVTSQRDDATAKIDRALLKKAKTVANELDIPLAELLSDLLEVPLNQKYAEVIRALKP